MRVVIAAVGRARAGPERALYEHYRARISKQVFSHLTLKEVELRQAAPPAELAEREGALLLAALPPEAVAIALDETGETLSSEALARLVAAQRDAGARHLAFVIGGADGLSDDVRARARHVLSFGQVTWPHMLVRALLAEQLYRVQCILTGHPYHRA